MTRDKANLARYGTVAFSLPPTVIIKLAQVDIENMKKPAALRNKYVFFPRHIRRAKENVENLLNIAIKDSSLYITTYIPNRVNIYKDKAALEAALSHFRKSQ